MEGKASDWRPGPTVCRCCLTEGCYKDISTEYFWMGKREVYAEMLAETLSVSIAFSKSGGPNSNSRLICEPCIARLRDASEFKRQVIDCEKTFMHHLDPGSTSKPRDVETVGEVKIELVKREKDANSDDDFDSRADFLDIDSDDDLDDQPLTKLASKIPKKESVDLLELLDSSQITVKRKSNLKLKAPPKKIVKKKEPVAKPSASKPAAKQAEKKKGGSVHPASSMILKDNGGDKLTILRNPIPLDSLICIDLSTQETIDIEERANARPRPPEARPHQPRHLARKAAARACALGIPDKRSSKGRTSIWQMTVCERENAATFLECTTVKPFFYQQANYKCFYCTSLFPEIQLMLQHSTIHSPSDRETLLKEYLKKGQRVIKVDISGLECRLCQQKYSDLDAVRKHLTATHKKEFNSAGNGLIAYDLSLNNGMLSCHKCTKSFNSFFSLNHHMNAHFSVVCETCGLGFMSHQRLVNHKVVHEVGVHTCDVCQEVFPTKLKLRYHKIKRHEKTNMKRIKPLKCPHCLERFTEHYKKMTHLKTVHGISFTFDCPVCKAVLPTRRALTEHTTKNHTQKIQCTVCEKCFGTQSLLKMHMRGHTGERNFFCDVCQKSFMHAKTLRQHVRAHNSYRFTCSECNSGFQTRNDYGKHMKQWHPHCPFKKNLINFTTEISANQT